jgi:hypothetical protein
MLPKAHSVADFYHLHCTARSYKSTKATSIHVFRVLSKLHKRNADRQQQRTSRLVRRCYYCYKQGIGGRDYRVRGYICVMYNPTRGTHERAAFPPDKITNLGTKSPVLIKFELDLLNLQLCAFYICVEHCMATFYYIPNILNSWYDTKAGCVDRGRGAARS